MIINREIMEAQLVSGPGFMKKIRLPSANVVASVLIFGAISVM